ncbi:MAG: hypothetical protein AB9891_15745 [Anaerolineaceae bacterium]
MYLWGLTFAMLFWRRLPIGFIVTSGFLWGVVGYVILALIILVSTIPYRLISMSIAAGMIFAVFVFFHIRNKTLIMDWQKRLWIGGAVLVFFTIELFLAMVEPISFTLDSHSLIQIGRWIGTEGFTDIGGASSSANGYGVFSGIADFGLLVPVIQSISVLIGSEYISMLSPLMALSLAGMFMTIAQQVLQASVPQPIARIALTVLFAVQFFSDRLIIRQIFYLHTNLVSAVYLFAAVVCIWLSAREGKFEWLIFAILALTGFSLTRTESPLFTVVVLILIVSELTEMAEKFSALLFSFIAFAAGWYIWLSSKIFIEGLILSPTTTLAIAGLLIMTAGVILLLKWTWFKKDILPWLPVVMLSVLALALVVTHVVNREHMLSSTHVVFQNLFTQTGEWGIVWYAAVVMAGLSIFRPQLPHERIFTIAFGCFISMVLLLGFFRQPYRLAWSDSANRMMTHILPLVYFFFLMKFFFNEKKMD